MLSLLAAAALCSCFTIDKIRLSLKTCDSAKDCAADEIHVTGDSVSMLSEAVVAGKPVGLIPLELNPIGAIIRMAEAGDEAAQPDEDEDIETKAFSIEELRSMIRRGEIIDLKTVAGLALMTESR